jgi:hypothetical protein
MDKSAALGMLKENPNRKSAHYTKQCAGPKGIYKKTKRSNQTGLIL